MVPYLKNGLLGMLRRKSSVRDGIRYCSRNRSSLFVCGKYGTKLTPTVIPDADIMHYLDTKEKMDEVHRSLLQRKIPTSSFPDLDKIVDGGKYLRWIQDGMFHLEARRQQIRDEFGKGAGVDEEELREEARDVKKSIKGLTRDLWSVEESIVLDFLRLPNRLHHSTPLESCEIVHQSEGSHELPEGMSEEDVVFVHRPYRSCYLEGKLAELEMNINVRVQNQLLDAGLQMMSGPDFTRACVVEGCDPEMGNLFVESPDDHSEISRKMLGLAQSTDFGDMWSGSGTYLAGGASVHAFVGHFVKNIITNPSACLPLSYFCLGRVYNGSKQGTEGVPAHIFNLQQSSVAALFAVGRSEQMLEAQLNFLTKVLVEVYEAFGLPFRLVRRPAAELSSCESLRIAVEITGIQGGFVEVGHLAVHGDYISRRLMLMYEDPANSNSLSPLFTLYGTVVDVTKLIGCFLDRSRSAIKA